MFYCDRSRRKFKILNTFNELLCYCGFALDVSSCIGNSHTEKISLFRRSAVLTNRLNHNIFLCFYVFGHSLCWSEKTFCLEDVGILRNGRIKIILKIIIIDTYIAWYPLIAQSAV